MTIIAVHRSATHTLQKYSCSTIKLLKGLGVEGDAHSGKTVKHRSRVRKDPTQPNLRQVHLIHSELHDELALKGFKIQTGQMGENITTKGIALLDLPRGTKLHLGKTAIVEVTGLRNPCVQLEGIQKGLMQAVLDRDKNGHLIRKAGIMGIVFEGGVVNIGNAIWVEYPEKPYFKLERV